MVYGNSQMTLEWLPYGTRIKYVIVDDKADALYTFYVCLDGKFHSWLTNENPYHWIARTVTEPHVATKVSNACDWFEMIYEKCMEIS